MNFFMNPSRQGMINTNVPTQNPMQYATAPISQAQIMANVKQYPDPIRMIVGGLYAQQQPNTDFQSTGNQMHDLVMMATAKQREEEQAQQSKMAEYLRRFSNG
jgi:hypothetical protein